MILQKIAILIIFKRQGHRRAIEEDLHPPVTSTTPDITTELNNSGDHETILPSDRLLTSRKEEIPRAPPDPPETRGILRLGIILGALSLGTATGFGPSTQLDGSLPSIDIGR